MTPEYYGNLYRRYQTYVRDYDSRKHICKIACGANIDDGNWTEGVLNTCFHAPHPEHAHGFMDGLSLHYYVHAGDWEHKGSATDFDEKAWYATLYKALYIEELINKHGAIMDQYDPDKKIGMMVDEWGCWHDVEPGTNPGFLYQQNTMRDALVAAVSLNIFNKHSDRVKMACIAQMVNVLQSMILTEGEKMLLTPTYHVFHMYKEHQDADLVESWIHGAEKVGMDDWQMPALQESASVDEKGVLTVTVANMSVDSSSPVDIVLTELCPKKVEARILTDKMQAHNTFEEPDRVKEQTLEAVAISGREVSFTIPPCAVVSLRIQ